MFSAEQVLELEKVLGSGKCGGSVHSHLADTLCMCWVCSCKPVAGRQGCSSDAALWRKSPCVVLRLG